ncbi:hypothetical protein ABH15_04460 [Methanoculleus taiwanensis]|uniref:Uncharacterized protein n=1 Tax=Methanoculleus taiwanensis TaxID=1550565 RepID=A0A498H2Q3_9EURY|nr:hypothetical protein ABH15_04460 [Methanoculleus taiwanensis]
MCAGAHQSSFEASLCLTNRPRSPLRDASRHYGFGAETSIPPGSEVLRTFDFPICINILE